MAARSGQRLVSPVALVVMVVAIVFILILLFPQRVSFLGSRHLEHPDALSIAYLRALVRSDAGNTELKITLARQLLSIGKWQEASDVLHGIFTSGNQDSAELLLLRIDLAIQQLAALPKNSKRRQELKKELSIWINHLLPLELDVASQKKLASLMLRYNRPDIAAKIFRELAWQEKSRAMEYWVLAAKWMLASGQPGRAGEYYFKAYDRAKTDRERQEYASKGIDALLAASEYGKLLGYLDQVLKRYPENTAFLKIGISIARLQGDLQKAGNWNLLLVGLVPDDLDTLVRQRDIELQKGDLQLALHYARQVVAKSPGNRVSRKKLALIAEWAGQPQLAQQQWQWLADHDASTEHDQQLLRLAKINRDDAGIIHALSLLAQKRPLSKDEWEMLVWAWVHRGEPEQAEKKLTEYLKSHPEDRLAWHRLTLLQQDMGHYRDEIQSWKSIEQQFGERPDSILSQVELHWRLYEPDRAYAELKRVDDFDDVENEYHLALAGELGWREMDDELAFRAYQALWARDRSSSLAAKRLIALAVLDQQDDVAIRVVEQLPEENRDQILLYAMSMASQNQRNGLLGKILAHTEGNVRLQQYEAYWLFLAQWHSHENRHKAVVADLENALRLNPASAEVRSGLLWALLATGNKKKLAKYIRLWQKDIDDEPLLWSPYAIALKTIGHYRESLYWYARKARISPDDYLWLLDYADALDQAGWRNSAYRVRLYVLQYLRPKALQALNKDKKASGMLLRYTSLARDLKGNVAAQPWVRWLQKTAIENRDKLASEFVIAWFLSREAYAPARYWLMRQHVQRMQTTGWQQITLALADNDLQKIQRLLMKYDNLPITTQVVALRQTGKGQQALQLALENNSAAYRNKADASVLRQQAVDLLQGGYSDWGLDFDMHEISDLLVRSRDAHYRHGRQSWFVAVRGRQYQLSGTSTYDLSGIADEAEYRLDGGWFGKRNRFSGYVGNNNRADGNLSQAGASWQYLFSQNLSLRLMLDLNAVDEVSAPFRLAGVLDDVSLKLNASIGSREYLNLNLQYNEYQSRQGQSLGRGPQLDFELGHRLATGRNSWALSVQGNFENNALESVLPADIAARMPTGSRVADLVPAKVALLGLGISLNRGNPKRGYPNVASPRYMLSGWFGSDLANNQPSGRLEAGLGIRLFGSDELSFLAYYSRATSPLRPDRDFGLRLGYHYFLGR